MQVEQRVAFIIRGVVRQALRDARMERVRVAGSERGRELVRRWCDVAIADDSPAPALLLNTATKTELLLGRVEPASIYPFGDLYASDLQALDADPDMGEDLMSLAAKAGGIAALDDVLRRLFEERRDPGDAFVAAPHLREVVMHRLDQTRFFRMRIGIVPKIGARTLGIDLFV